MHLLLLLAGRIGFGLLVTLGIALCAVATSAWRNSAWGLRLAAYRQRRWPARQEVYTRRGDMWEEVPTPLQRFCRTWRVRLTWIAVAAMIASVALGIAISPKYPIPLKDPKTGAVIGEIINVY